MEQKSFYIIPFAKCPAVDTDHLMSLRFLGFRNVVTLGSITFYCRATRAYSNCEDDGEDPDES